MWCGITTHCTSLCQVFSSIIFLLLLKLHGTLWMITSTKSDIDIVYAMPQINQSAVVLGNPTSNMIPATTIKTLLPDHPIIIFYILMYYITVMIHSDLIFGECKNDIPCYKFFILFSIYQKNKRITAAYRINKCGLKFCLGFTWSSPLIKI